MIDLTKDIRDDYLDRFSIDRLISAALEEDIGSGDVTTDSVVDPDRAGKGEIMARESMVLAGLDVACKVFVALDPQIEFGKKYKDGDWIAKGRVFLEMAGNLRVLLKGERTALNFLQRLSGIATLARQYADRVAGTGVRIVDTRKTTPGWRYLEKYAVRVGGCHNHRFGLYDGVLIKENHIEAAGGITEAITRARASIHHLLKIEIEVTSIEQIEEALANKADIIMLDNMNPAMIRESVALINKRALVEVSGGVNLENIPGFLQAGVDLISAGALTHSAQAVDISMLITAGHGGGHR
jgi:nicotinate-nucleotide pyrophosphorylase (carboxylating)